MHPHSGELATGISASPLSTRRTLITPIVVWTAAAGSALGPLSLGEETTMPMSLHVSSGICRLHQLQAEEVFSHRHCFMPRRFNFSFKHAVDL